MTCMVPSQVVSNVWSQTTGSLTLLANSYSLVSSDHLCNRPLAQRYIRCIFYTEYATTCSTLGVQLADAVSAALSLRVINLSIVGTAVAAVALSLVA